MSRSQGARGSVMFWCLFVAGATGWGCDDPLSSTSSPISATQHPKHPHTGSGGSPACGGGGGQPHGGHGGSTTTGSCSNITTVPSTPSLAGPSRGAYTGRGPAGQPVFAWRAVPILCADQTFQLQLDDSCIAGRFDTCAFASPEVDVTTPSSQLTFTPATPLPVHATAPVGARYAWRVRACAGATNCGAWSETWFVNVGRVKEDINGDGFGDLLARSTNSLNLITSRFEVYPGSPNPTSVTPAFNIGPDCITGAFLGDVDGDGFGDVGCLRSELIPTQRTVPVILFGGTTLSNQRTIVLSSEQGSVGSIMQISAAGDLNGDGFADIDIEWVNLHGTGAVPLNLHYGSASFADTPPNLSFLGPPLPPGVLTVLDQSRGVGDVNGDGYDDLALFHNDFMGRVFRIYLGGRTPDGLPDAEVALGAASDAVPWAAGDLQGDGFADVLIGATGSGLGFYRGASTLPTAMTVIAGTTTSTLTFAGFDLNGDRRSDFLVQTPAGSAVYLGGTTFTTVNGALSHLTGASFATSDYNGDGRADFAGAAPSPDGISPATLSRIMNDGTMDPLAASLVGPGDGYQLKAFVVP